MAAFSFDDSKNFDANWSAFMTELQTVDSDMAAILAANKDRLAAIVRQGERNASARSTLNAAVIAALDGLEAQETDGAP